MSTEAELLDRVSALLGRRDLTQVEFSDWLAGSADGGPLGGGSYPLSDSTGFIRRVWSPARLQANLARTADITFTVGATGKFATLNAALAAACALRPGYRSQGVRVEIRQLSGFVMVEQVMIAGRDLSWITITSEDPEVIVHRAALDQQFTAANDWRAGVYAAFAAVSGAGLPVIATLYNMDQSGNGDTRAGFVIKDIKAFFTYGAGVRNAAWRGQYAFHAFVNARFAVFAGAGGTFSTVKKAAAIRATNGSVVLARDADLSGSTSDLYVSQSICQAQTPTSLARSTALTSPDTRPAMALSSRQPRRSSCRT